MSAFRDIHNGRWTAIAPVSLPGVHVRHDDGSRYLVSAYGGDDEGGAAPDDDAILAAARRVLGYPLEWIGTWNVTNESTDGEVVRALRIGVAS